MDTSVLKMRACLSLLLQKPLPINIFVIEAHDGILIIQGLHVLLQRDNQPVYVCTHFARKAFGAHTTDFHIIICWHMYHLMTIFKKLQEGELVAGLKNEQVWDTIKVVIYTFCKLDY